MLPPAYGACGNGERNEFRSEPFRVWDVSISKDVRFTERFSGQFRFEAFNVLNKTQYDAGSTTSSDNPAVTGSFGSFRQTPDVGIANATVGSGGPRSLQMGLRLQF